MSYGKMLSGMTNVISSATAANMAGIYAQNKAALRQEKDLQRQSMWQLIGQGFAMGSSAYKGYKENKETIDYAKEHGFETTSSKWNNIFGEPKFRHTETGLDADRSFILGMKGIEEYVGQKNLLDIIGGM